MKTGTIMESRNFEFLRKKHAELADLASFAEYYAYTDPAGALVKLRSFGEQMVATLFQHFRMQRPYNPKFIDYLLDPTFKATYPTVIQNKLHALRKEGNQAVHGATNKATSNNALWALRQAFDLAKWFELTLYGTSDVKKIQYVDPEKPENINAEKLKQQNKAALQKIAYQEAQMQKLLEELEAAREKAPATEINATMQGEILAKGIQAANTLAFNEEETRKQIIDRMLVAAGWDVAPDYKSTEEVGKEIEVKDQPTNTGIGYADYVLWDDNHKPLAVIEAKKASLGADNGKEQARIYADGLEKQYGQRPIIFYTNGHETYIWDDSKAEVPRRIFGFYSKESLQRCYWKNTNRIKLSECKYNDQIIDRMYQIEAVRRVTEKFESNRRKALIVQATGTGKTRVAIALSDMLINARWVKRILFLCDRKELRKQAFQNYQKYLKEPITCVNSATSGDKTSSVYLATYPAMMQCYESFDVGFFDLIIADESHRSIYNRYKELFMYFDCLQVGLTATPIDKIVRNTYQMFECEDKDPTVNYSYKDAIEHVPPYLAHFKVTAHTTKFLRQGIKYTELSDEQKRQLDEQVEESELIDYNKEQVSKDVFNKDTDRKILRNLMENGIKDATGNNIGKTIIFARNHSHAVSLYKLFNEMYPQYMLPKQEFCAVIDNYVERAEQLIDDFKGEGNNPNLTIAISVDMLDTGIDVPQVVNLVFAKPVKSFVKFWQMIGRGTRLCENLFGPGKHKTEFQIFDHWGNFEFFGMNYPEENPSRSKSLFQKIFEQRLELAQTALTAQNQDAFNLAIELLGKDIKALPDTCIAVQEKWREKKTVEQPQTIRKFDAATQGMLFNEIAPLMQWRPKAGHTDGYLFDLTIARAQTALLQGSSDFDDYMAQIKDAVAQLPINLSQVAEKMAFINKVKDSDFWKNATVQDLEEIRTELRGIMHCRTIPNITKAKALTIDITDGDEQRTNQPVKLDGLDLAAYRSRVESIFKDLFEDSIVLQKIKAGEPVNESEIRPLIEKVLFREPDLHVDELLLHFPNTANRLDLAIRQVIGLDAEKVNEHFTAFVRKYTNLTSHQIRFLELIKKHITNYGGLEIEKLWEAPFTQINIDGIDGVFTKDEQVNDLLDLINQINEIVPK
jgi:type I restriction enzyme R subunit